MTATLEPVAPMEPTPPDAAVGRLGDAPLLPLGVLSAFFLFDQIDTTAFGVLVPEVKAEFHLSNAGIGLLLAFNFLVLLALSVVVGHLADRHHRVRLTILLAGVACVGSVLTGLAPVLAILVIARVVNGIGIVSSTAVHRSLLTDYYRPEDRGTVFGVHAAAEQAANIGGPLAIAGMAAVVGWRPVFIVLAVPIALVALVATKLREPLRGGTDDAALAADAELEPPLPFGQAVRTLAKSRTLQRTWLALVFVGGGFIPIATFAPLFYRTVFGLSLLERGVAGALGAASGVAGLLLAGAWVRRTLPVSAARVQVGAGLAFVGVAVAVTLFALSPNAYVAVAMSCLLSLVAGLFVPASTAVQSLVVPARVRSQAFAFGGLFLAAGAFLSPIAGNLADSRGLRVGMIAFAPLVLIGGVVMASAARFVDDDRAAALDLLETAARLRRERVAGGPRPLLLTRGLDVSYGSVQVLFGVDFEVQEGEIVALLGTNGAGKSTLLKAVAGLLRPDRGIALVDGVDVASMTAWETAAQGVVLMPGGKAVFPLMTVGENLRLSAWLLRKEPEVVAERVELALETFPRLRERYDQVAGNLSGGEQQMLSLAQAFIARPKLLMIDELSLGLAPKVVGELLEIVRAIHRQGTTIVLVEQSVNVAMTIAQRAYFLEKGEVRFSGATADLLARDDILRSVFLEGAAKAAEVAGARRSPRRVRS